MAAELAPAQQAFLRSALALAGRSLYRRLVFVSDLPIPDSLLPSRSRLVRKLVYAVTSEAQRAALAAQDVPAVVIPPYELTRMERYHLALTAGVAHDLLVSGEVALGLVGRKPTSYPDTMMLSRIGPAASAEHPLRGRVRGLPGPPEIVEAVLDLALAIGAEGWEGHGVGTLLVLGDSNRVMERSKQLALNPFYGYTEAERDVRDPRVREAVRAFATLDGAFVIRDDGVVLAAGRYLSFEGEVSVPLGLGARHMAGAGITRETSAIAFVVSQTSGVVRVFRRGEVTLEVSPARRRV